MKYIGMPAGMWLLFASSFKRQLSETLRFTSQQAEEISHQAKKRYRQIIADLPEFERGDRFRMNIVSCAMLSGFILAMPQRSDTDLMADYYRRAMMIPVARRFFRLMGRQKFTARDLSSMKKTATFRAADRNPYSWNMDYLPYEDGSGYEARFYHCGICTLMNELGLQEYISAMCKLDYAMSEAGGSSHFIRSCTLAGGGPYCDCGYKKKRA